MTFLTGKVAAYPHSIKRELLKDVSPKAENM
jgi:hypothetical protein